MGDIVWVFALLKDIYIYRICHELTVEIKSYQTCTGKYQRLA